MRLSGFLAVSALALTLAACGDSSDSPSADNPVTPKAMTPADCADAGSALGYLDQRQKALITDVQANKPVADKFNAFLATVQAEADKARASGDWVGYCKAVDAALTSAGY